MTCRHVGKVQERLAADGNVSCDLMNVVSGRYQKLASAVQGLERAAERQEESARSVERARVVVDTSAADPNTPADVDSSNLRQRRPITAVDARAELLGPTDGEEDAGVDHHQMQEALAADMLDMTKTLKHILKETGKTLEDDEDVIVSATAGADRSIQKQATANDMLSEQIKRSGGCWMWLLLLTVATSFLGMIVFMRIF